MKKLAKPAVVFLAFCFSVAWAAPHHRCQDAQPSNAKNQMQTSSETQSKTQKRGKTVYVCACLKTKSCSCMTEAKTEGPCSCGTEGGPPMKAVPSNSAWAKANRDALAK